MNVSDHTASIALARLVWREDKRYFFTLEDGTPVWYAGHEVGTLYDEEHMAAAWRVLNWWLGYEIKSYIRSRFHDSFFRFYGVTKPARAQRLWLDKIYSAAVEEGLIKEEAVHE